MVIKQKIKDWDKYNNWAINSYACPYNKENHCWLNGGECMFENCYTEKYHYCNDCPPSTQSTCVGKYNCEMNRRNWRKEMNSRLLENIVTLQAQIKDFRFTHEQILSDEGIQYLTNQVLEQILKIAQLPLFEDEEIKKVIRKQILEFISCKVHLILVEDEELNKKLRSKIKEQIIKMLEEE